ncbi:MAG: heavy metal translocating P-type ATPase [Firmicutes bacterium]|nr:heavy metal translocating P-type ATPase [Bacillota bacterium]
MNKKLLQIILATIIYIPTFFIKPESTLQISLFIISYLLVGGSILINAIRNLKHGNFLDENFLMSIATLGAFYIKAYPEAIAVMLFYQIGEFFQDYAVDKSKKSITSLMELKADQVNLKTENGIIVTNSQKIEIGSFIIIKPGERIPLDGIITEGNSYIDTSALTGETLPKEVSPGSDLLSGCINLSGLLVVQTTNTFGDSTVSKILELVENASNKKSAQEKFITKFARYYTPIVVLLGLMIVAIPTAILGLSSINTWLYRSLAFLVVSCPCALVVSIPLSFFAGIGVASKEGILIKGSNYLEALAKVETVVFDKTGTLTKGVFEVQKVVTFNDFSKSEVLEYAAYGEVHSDHPISQSLKRAYGAEIIEDRIIEVNELAGLGIIAKVDDKIITIGNMKLMNHERIDSFESSEERTIIHIGIDGIYAGYITIADELKADSKKAIESLNELGISKIVMLTGDSITSAEKIAGELGISNYHGDLMPIDKLNQLEYIMVHLNKKGKTIFVGDGINDAPVLARADIGIAMGGIGRDAAIEAADVVIMEDEPIKVAIAIKLAKRTVKIATANIILAISIKVIVLFLSALGYASLWMAVFADVGVTIIAVLNSLRILRRKRL